MLRLRGAWLAICLRGTVALSSGTLSARGSVPPISLERRLSLYSGCWLSGTTPQQYTYQRII